jgi:MFS family permease
MDIITPILNIVLGILLLTTGKKLFWLLVAVVGFVIGLAFTQYLLVNPPWLVYVLALGVGIIGAVMALLVQKLAISLVGFIAGGYGALYLSDLFAKSAQSTNWMAFIIGGIVGLLLVASVFDWALYILSAWAGSTLVTKTVTEGVGINGNLGMVLFFVLFFLGLIIQVGLFRDQPKPKPAEVKPEDEPAKKGK